MEIQLYYKEQGTGTPLLLLHGNGEDSSFFRHQMEEFSQDHRVIAIDTRGHGQSPLGDAPFTLTQFAADVLDFMDDHGLAQADILGFSDGANIALLFALDHPERVGRLVLNAANLCPEGLEPWLLNAFLRSRERAMHSDAPDRDYKIALLNLMIHEPHIDPDCLSNLKLPVLVIAGDQDIVQLDHTLMIARRLPHARLAILPGGHDVAAVHPHAFNQAVRAFWEEDVT